MAGRLTTIAPMRWRPTTVSLIGYGLVVILLGGAFVVSSLQLDASAVARTARLKDEEASITNVERLRALSAAATSAGRGYIITADNSFLQSVSSADALFSTLLRELHREVEGDDPVGETLLKRVETTKATFVAMQDELFAERHRADDLGALTRRFEADLAPLQRQLTAALDAVADHQHNRLDHAYVRSEHERQRALRATLGLAATLVFLAFAFTTYFGLALGRTFRREQKALGRAEQALATRDQVLAIVAHDLRAPLAAIVMQAGMIRRAGELPGAHEKAEVIENLAMRMEYLIKGLLDVSRMEAGEFSVRLADCEVQGLIDEIESLFNPLAAAKGVRLQTHVDQPGLVVLADRERIMQVLSNLVTNAITSTPPGGTIDVSAQTENGSVRFAVADTGAGIPLEHQSRLFERFWRPTGATKGAGLGLFIARGVVEAHEGRIWVDSRPGQGARFYFTVPRAEGG